MTSVAVEMCVDCGTTLDELDAPLPLVETSRHESVAIGAGAVAWNGPACRYCRDLGTLVISRPRQPQGFLRRLLRSR